MWYEINVARNGRHFFATDKRSIIWGYDLENLLSVFREKFPESEGYKITVTKYETIGQEIEI